MTPEPLPSVHISRAINVRAGPGTLYAVLGVAGVGDSYPLLGRNEEGSWWQIAYGGLIGWVLADLVEAEGVGEVPLAQDIPPLPAQAITSGAGGSEIQPATTAPEDPCAYVGNKNSKKFHRAACEWVAQMHPGNKVCFSNRQEALNAGYEPCKSCNP